MVGPTPAELESLNELIKFDHIYYKNQPLQLSKTGPDTKIVQSEKPKGKINLTISCDDEVKKEIKSEVVDTCTDLDTKFSADSIINEIHNLLPDMNMDLLKDIENYIENEMDIEPSQICSDAMDAVSQGDKITVCEGNKSESIKEKLKSTVRNSRKRRLSSLVGIVPSVEPTDILTVDDHCTTLGSDSGMSSDYSDAGSPFSDTNNKFGDVPSPLSDISTGLSEDPWEESFIELFPNLV